MEKNYQFFRCTYERKSNMENLHWSYGKQISKIQAMQVCHSTPETLKHVFLI